MQNPGKGLSVRKRNGTLEEIDISKIRKRLETLCFDLDMNYVLLDKIVEKVVSGIYNEVETKILDNLAGETCAYMNIFHPHYSLLAARISINNLHKETDDSFMGTINTLYNYMDKANRPAPLIADDVYKIIVVDNFIDLLLEFYRIAFIVSGFLYFFYYFYIFLSKILCKMWLLINLTKYFYYSLF